MAENRRQDVERSLIKKFRKPIWNRFIMGIKDYGLINEGDKIAVCISGGKDSMLLACLLQHLQKYSEVNFELCYLVMNPGYNQRNMDKIMENAEILDLPIDVFESDIFDSVHNVENSPCYLCARMRRGHLYKNAKDRGCNKIALGHHFDDVIETILMGMLYGGQMQTMMPKLHSTNFEGMELIRPLYMVREEDIITWREYNNLEFIQCACRFTENAHYEHGVSNSKRLEIKHLIADLHKINPNVENNIFRSSHNVNLSTIIGYHKNDFEYDWLKNYDKCDSDGFFTED